VTPDVAEQGSEPGERVSLTDVSVALGRQPRAEGGSVTVKQLLSTMDEFGISYAVVSNLASRWHAPAVGNRELVETLAGADRLHACWTVLPDVCGEVADPDEFVEQARAAGVVAVRAFPADHRYRLDGPDMTALHRALVRARLPLLVEASQTSWEAVEAVARRFDGHTLIVGDVGYRSLRSAAGALSRCDNLHLDISYLASHCGLEWLVGRFGAGRLLFGTGWPLRDPAEAVTRLLWSELDDDAARQVGGGNARRLFGVGAGPS
jgi:predicted TIM-barrel fold metal-dependent hydrolase